VQPSRETTTATTKSLSSVLKAKPTNTVSAVPTSTSTSTSSRSHATVKKQGTVVIPTSKPAYSSNTSSLCCSFWSQIECRNSHHDFCRKVQGKVMYPTSTKKKCDDNLTFHICNKTYTIKREGLEIATLAFTAWSDAIDERDRKEAEWFKSHFVKVHNSNQPKAYEKQSRLEWNHLFAFYICDEQYHKTHGKLLTLAHLHSLPSSITIKLLPIWYPP